MKCSHCGSPVALRSRHCPKCGAPQDITVRHRQELDANIGAVVRKWILDEVASRAGDTWKEKTPYEQMTSMIEYVAEVRRGLAGTLRELTERGRPTSMIDRRFEVSREQALFHEVMGYVHRFVDGTRIDYLLSEIERVLRDERYDLEHERVMSRIE